METQLPPSDGGKEDPLAAIKESRQQLVSRIENLHNTQIELIASLQTLVPNLVADLDLSQKTISAFNARPFTPLPAPLPAPSTKSARVRIDPVVVVTKKLKTSPEKSESDGFPADDCGPLSVVRSMVAVCLQRVVPFTAIDSATVLRKLENEQSSATAADRAALRELGGETGAILAVEMALRSMAGDNGGLQLEEYTVSGKSRMMVMNIDRTRLLKVLPESKQFESNSEFKSPMWTPSHGMPPVFPRSGRGMQGIIGMPRGVGVPPPMRTPMMGPPIMGSNAFKPMTEEECVKDVEALLNTKSVKEKEKSETGEELKDLLHRPTAKETAAAAKFRSRDGPQVKEYCKSLTKEDCRRRSGSYIACALVHFRRIISLHTDVNLGDCSFLDTCRHMKTCKYVHYELDSAPDMSLVPLTPPKPLKRQREHYCSEKELGESQWINCDIRSFRMDILGHFGVIMADPPWDIHMELPYGTMADDEMRTLNVPALQTDGLIFLWVTGRAMELGRECLELWGYTRTEEIIWVKTNQLQRIIRTGRTGHWLNHSKEHCLVGIKGNPDVIRNIDTDVLVAEVRETSRKPDEMYSLLERIMPGARKLELFARMHNCHHGWMSLGNQLNGARLVDDDLRARFKAAYPDVVVQPASPPRSSAMDVDPVPLPPARTSSGQGDPKTSGAPPAEPTPPVPQKPANLDVEMTT